MANKRKTGINMSQARITTCNKLSFRPKNVMLKISLKAMVIKSKEKRRSILGLGLVLYVQIRENMICL